MGHAVGTRGTRRWAAEAGTAQPRLCRVEAGADGRSRDAADGSECGEAGWDDAATDVADPGECGAVDAAAASNRGRTDGERAGDAR